MASGKLINDKQAIFLINISNFLNQKPFETTISFLEDVEVEQTKAIMLSSEIKNKEIIDFLSNSSNYVKEIIETKYSQINNIKFEYCKWVREPELIKWKSGSSLEAHTDGPYKENPPILTLGALIYLNDDYSGGELIFPEYDIIIKPKFGDLVIFPCHYLHQVSQIIGKDKYRYTMPLFYTFIYKENNDD